MRIGDAIVYNDGFFEPDFFDPTKVVMKNSMNVKVVLWESYQTLEDASSISKKLSEKFTTKITKIKDIIVTFDQSVSKLVKVGDSVDSDSILCIIEDSVTANNNLFNENSIDTLRLISAQTPRARVKGIVEKIEIFYHGDKDDMTTSLRKLADDNDKELTKLANSLGTNAYTGSVDSGLRIDNDPLGLDNLCIRIYITSSTGAYVGDKAVFSNQLKSVVSEVLDNDLVTEDGQVIDAVFGSRSISDRIVLSPYIIGTTNELLEVVAKRAIQAYRS